MNLCDYGCGNEGIYQLKNGKWCCHKSPNSCPKNIEKNSKKHREYIYKECPICHKFFVSNTGGQYNEHVKSCSKIYGRKCFLENKNPEKYLNWYNNIIKNRQENPLLNGYREKHHILPRSLGGTNNKENLIYLTAKEHFICHMLLIEIYRKEKIAYRKMLSALMMMKSRDTEYMNSRLYEKYKKEFSEVQKENMKGKNNGNYGYIWITNIKTKEIKRIRKELENEYKSEEWIKGKINDWDNYYAVINNISMKDRYYKEKKKKDFDIFEYIKKEKERKEQLKNNREEKRKLYEKYYEEYKINGFKGVVKKFNYTKTNVNLIRQFHRYLNK